ncbi:MJ0042-type zinc finger domain-containing protein, partial [Azovibrio restrictus]|uniref:MJ0042-type zinc finger domain-containing protein n=1 Tax=Azovibrio restrictus TaxID=146938 RepID=UPI0026F14D30
MFLTRCPACATTFRLSGEQLQARAGMVRCGNCRQPFNALKHLVAAPEAPAGTEPTAPRDDTPPPAPEPAAPPPAAPEPSPLPAANRPAYIIRWGSIQGDDAADIVLNRKPALKNALDKEKTFSILKLNRVRRPAFVYLKPTTRFPVIAKSFWEDPRSSGIKLVRSYAEAVQSKADFFTEFVDVVKKYRAYVFDLKVFCLTKKIPVKSNTGLKKTGAAWQYEEIPQDMDA